MRLDALHAIPSFLLLEVAPESYDRAAFERLCTPLPRPGAEEVGMLAAHDLARIVPDVTAAGLCFLGASYDISELLRPGLPWLRLLAGQYRLSLSGEGFQQRLLFLGAVDGRLPDPALAPDPTRPPSPWRLLPLALVGNAQDLLPLEQQLEERLLDLGECAPPLATALASWFGVRIAHARHLSLLDLLALLRAQYRQAELDPLADLLEAALLNPTRSALSADGSAAWDGERVRLRPLLIDPEADLQAEQRTALRAQRRLIEGLQLHDLPLAWVAISTDAAAGTDDLLDAPLLTEELIIEGTPDASVSTLRVHGDPELGVLCVDGLDAAGARRCRLHPLSPAALQRIRQLLPDRPLL